MRSEKSRMVRLVRRIVRSFTEAAGALVGGLLFFLCCYWFFHYETWHERLIATGLTALVVYLLAKLLPERPEQ
ncbi:hypothetical protein ABW11_01685 [Pluralibacter gergoviae]|nr:hypothetical protein LG71_19045 [Pluralibacter gergoviae]AVR03856.1 hypothetical protein A8H26_14755 [Pluralibacter gergoviae]KMK06633.1 hypothetical protein ABW08_01240 [Pluralibacter gergoviae]KMK07992.1 hypothetical protein ABW07_13765 [Pluralibacter gergoviae]KMK30273.1 hypothetical protein ABW11_01685 [Pluralibacter gergoviae]